MGVLYSWAMPRPKGGPGGGSAGGTFPLSISSNGRFIQTAGGSPFLLNGDTVWMLPINGTTSDFDRYVNDRAAKGFTSITINAPAIGWGLQANTFTDIDGNDPFTTTSYATATYTNPTTAYWNRVDYLINAAKAKGLAVLMYSSYLGITSGTSSSQGFYAQMNAASAADLQSFGAFLGNRYQQGNIIWIWGGDNDTAAYITQAWNVTTGLRSIQPNAICGFEGQRTTSGFTDAGALTGFNFNTIYADQTTYDLAATEYARTGPIPFILSDCWYEGDGGLANMTLYRAQAYTAILSGACGSVMGNDQLWQMGFPFSTASADMDSNLNSTLANDMGAMGNFFASYSWQLLAPQTGTTVVTTSLGTGQSRICPALASDGSFAMIYTPSVNFTVDMTCITHASVRARWWDPATYSYSTDAASPLSNTGTHAFTAPGARVLVLD